MGLRKKHLQSIDATGNGEPPEGGSMEQRVSRLEGIVPSLATREDLARDAGAIRGEMHKGFSDIRVEMHKGFSDIRSEMHTQTWRIIGALGLVAAATIAVSKIF